MQEQMPDIDTSGIEALQKIKQELDVIAERLDKMETMKEKVSDQVYQKVFTDYNAKRSELETEAQPLKTEVRLQYRILKGAMQELETELAELQMQREELDFRKELGEFEDEFYDEEIKKLDLDATGKQADMDEALEMKELFLSVFDSEEDLEADNEPEPEPEPEPLEAEADLIETDGGLVEDLDEDLGEAVEDNFESDADDDLDEPLAEVEDAPELLEDESADFGEQIEMDAPDELDTEDPSIEDSLGPLPDVDEGDEETLEDDLEDLDMETAVDIDGDPGETASMPMDPNGPTAPSDDPMIPPPPPPPSSGGDDPDGTMIISNPKIIARNNDVEGQVFVLGMSTTSIGRSPENDVHLTEDRISRKHAQIAFGPGGYAIYDLNSENGSFVNGTRIREHFLSDGDIIMIGSYKFLYRDH